MSTPDTDPAVTPPGPSGPPPRPTWVKVFGIVLALVVVVVLVKAFAGGDHGPGRHLPGGNDAPVHTPMQHDS